MPYAILQKDLTPPPVEQLKRAFQAVKFLTALDAFTLASDAFGVLVNNLSSERAVALQGALRREGVETEIVEQGLLPQMPPTKFLHRLDCQPDALVLYDPLGRSFKLDWGHLMLIAAGSVRLTEFTSVEKTRYEPRRNWRGEYDAEAVTETVTREEQNSHLLLELILTRAVQRFSLTADRFNFAYLGERRTKSVSHNFALLVRDLMQFAPQAGLNRGAYQMREESKVLFPYPSKNAFLEEIIWLLWRMRSAQQG